MSLGATPAANIVPGTTGIIGLNNIPCQLNSLALKHTTTLEIDRLIKNLLNKNSHGHDEISNLMLKSLHTSITFPLSIQERVFPELMRRAEVIPLYKGKEMDYMVNYRPISLLITILKLLEKVMYS